MKHKSITEFTGVVILGASVISALSGQTDLAIAGIGIYLITLHITKGD